MFKIVRFFVYKIENNNKLYKIVVISKIKNDLYQSFLVLQKKYKNCIIKFKDKNNNSVIPYGSLFTKDKNNNMHTIYWEAKDKYKIYQGFFICL